MDRYIDNDIDRYVRIVADHSSVAVLISALIIQVLVLI